MKKFTFFIAAFMMSLFCSQEVSAWSFKADGWGGGVDCSPSANFTPTDILFYTDGYFATDNLTVYTVTLTAGNSTFNVFNNCGSGQTMWLTGNSPALSDGTIVRATFQWVESVGMHSNYTVVLPDGKVFAKAAGKTDIELTRTDLVNYIYKGVVTLANNTSSIEIHGTTITGNWGIDGGFPSAGKPSGVMLNIPNVPVTSASGTVLVTYNLKTNQVTYEDVPQPQAVVISSPNGLIYYLGDNPLQFTASATTTTTAAITDTTFIWSISPTTDATLNQSGSQNKNATFSASETGTYTLTAQITYYGTTKSASVQITVKEAREVTSVVFEQQKTKNLSSNESDIFFVNENVPYVLEIKDQYGNSMADAIVNFTFDNGGSVNTGTKIVKWTNVTDVATVTVEVTKVTTISKSFSVQIVPAFTNILPKTSWVATASSYLDGTLTPDKAIDNNTGTRWASGGTTTAGVAQTQWITVDLGKAYDINMVEVLWEGACARIYEIQVSQEEFANYQTIGGEIRDGVVAVGVETTYPHKWRSLSNTGQWARYIRIYCTVPATHWRYSIWEINVYGKAIPFEVRGDFTNWVPVVMNRIGLTDVYKVTIPVSPSSAPSPAPGKNHAPAAAGDISYKITRDGVWPLPTGTSGHDHNRTFSLTEETDVTFYAKDLGSSTVWFYVCDAEEMFLVGDVTGGDDFNANAKPSIDKNFNKYQYFVENLNGGNYMLRVKDDEGNLAIPDGIMNFTQNIGDAGKYQISFEYETFIITAQRLPDGSTDPWVYGGDEITDPLDFSYRLHEEFGGADLGVFTDNLYLGGDIQTYPIGILGVSIKMYYQIDNKTPVELDLPYIGDYYNSGYNTTNSKWQIPALVNILADVTNLKKGTHKLTVWFEAVFTGLPGNEYRFTYTFTDEQDKYTANFSTLGDIMLSVEDIMQQKIIIFPNPVNNELKIINCELKDNETAQIFDVAGKIVYSSSIFNNSINVSNLATGIYFLKIDNQVVKFIKK